MRKGYLVLLLLVLAIITLYGFGCCGSNSNTIIADQNGKLLAPDRYFPTEPGYEYTYRPVSIVDPLEVFTRDFSYTTEVNPLGDGVYFRHSERYISGPVFDGLEFTGLLKASLPDSETVWHRKPFQGGPTTLLPEELTGVGQQWLSDLSLTTCYPDNNRYFNYIAHFEVGAVEHVIIGDGRYSDCLRLDILVNDENAWPGPIELKGSIWFAPDVGPVRMTASYEGLKVAQIELLSREFIY